MFDGSEKKFRKATAFIETSFFTGRVTALALANPVVDVIVGNIIGVGDQPNLNEQSPTWKDDPDSAHKAHAYVSTRAQKSTANVNPNNSVDNKQAEKNENTSYKTAVSEFKREDLEKEQQSDPTLETVRAKAKNNDETYYTYNGIIFRRANNKTDFDQIVLPKSMRQEVLQACHDSPIAGHLGINATKKRMCRRFSWLGIIRDVNKYVKSCDVCQRNCNKLPNLPIQIADIIDKPFDKVAIDIVGPMMMSDSKNRFILALVDAATRWPEAVPLKSIRFEPRSLIKKGVGGTVAIESALRSAGTLLSRVRTPPPAPWPDGELESLRSPCCGLAIYKKTNLLLRLSQVLADIETILVVFLNNC
ncbi:gypsy retrotransposon integrase-like protein 1 [Plakobranchus ocellatus]|uniref:Gypsy retrotransposon integrase-like protein 1 n=1 Tax=Plakobranchus ocellatus TaxID=259542 RepID=A0AAV3ZT99_9GAST|nr:gypsy retrotransposon integrase-like protein 1 [Plakobranchus ocellatus]